MDTFVCRFKEVSRSLLASRDYIDGSLKSMWGKKVVQMTVKVSEELYALIRNDAELNGVTEAEILRKYYKKGKGYRVPLLEPTDSSS